MTREEDKGNGNRYARRRLWLELGRWFVAPIITVAVLALTNVIDIMVVTRESPKHIESNSARLTRVEQQVATLQLQIANDLGAMRGDVQVIKANLGQIINEHQFLLRRDDGPAQRQK